MRQNDWQAFIRDDWRMMSYVYPAGQGCAITTFLPTPKRDPDYLSTLDYVPNGGVPLPVQPSLGFGSRLRSKVCAQFSILP